MSNIRLNVTDQCICAVEMPAIYSGDVNYDTVTFTFSSDWNSYLKTAVFYRTKDEAYYQVLDRNNTCTIPKEVLRNKGTIFIAVFGTLDNKTITSQVISYRIQEGAITEDLNIPDPTPDIYAQALAKCTEAINIADGATSAIANKVDKISGKGLSSTDVTKEMVTAWNNKLDKTATAANSNKLGGKTESALSVASAGNAGKLGGKTESQLSVSKASSADKLGNKTESELSVSKAANADDAGKLGGKTESELSVANAKTIENKSLSDLVSMQGRNVISYPYIASFPVTKVGVTYTLNNDGSIRAIGRPESSSGVTICNFNLPAGMYTISGVGSNAEEGRPRIRLQIDGDYNDASPVDGKSGTFTLTKNSTIAITVQFITYNVDVDFTFKPMIEIGMIAHAFEPPVYSSITLKNIIDEINGNYYKNTGGGIYGDVTVNNDVAKIWLKNSTVNKTCKIERGNNYTSLTHNNGTINSSVILTDDNTNNLKYENSGVRKDVHHDGNSAKTIISTSAPSDTSALWIDIS